MKAVAYTEYGPPEVLQLVDVERPFPRDDEVRINVHAASVNGSDWEGLRGKPLYARFGGLVRPHHQILGSDIAGRVERTGRNSRRFRPGDCVFGDNLPRGGGFAEAVCVPETTLARMPATMTFEEAAAIPQGAVIALQGIRDRGRIQPGQHVLINGAGGSAGMFAVQLAKSYGATVTGVDNAGKSGFLRSLGADRVIDCAQEDFAQSGKQYDLILDVIAHRSVFAYERALRPGGSALVVGGSVATLFQVLFLGPWIRRATGKRIGILAVRPNPADLAYMAELCAAGTIIPVIDRRYPLSKVPEALRYLGEGLARGKVIISVEANHRR